MTKYTGVCIYEILPDGCLNGVWSDNYKKTENQIFNEIARKVDLLSDKIEGKYICSYTDFGNQSLKCELDIEAILQGGTCYKLVWKCSGFTINGTGWLTRHNQLSVSFEYEI